MWASTRSCVAERVAIALLLALLAAPAGGSGHAPALPRAVIDLAPGLAVRGGGSMSFFGIDVYDGWYWTSQRGWPADAQYALDLTYHRDFEGTRIAQRSEDEMARLGYGTAEERARWRKLMARIFPDVRKGDRITGLHDEGGRVRYFHNGQPIGTIQEQGFAQAFFGIWLDPRTSRNDFREKLLGKQ